MIPLIDFGEDIEKFPSVGTVLEGVSRR